MNMNKILLTLLFFTLLADILYAKGWEIKRNPFVVSKSYMDRTGKHYLMPRDTYGFIDIKIKGVIHRKGTRKILIDLGDKGFIYMKEGEKRDIDTPDIMTTLKVVKIERNHVLVSINDGEAIRHEIK